MTRQHGNQYEISDIFQSSGRMTELGLELYKDIALEVSTVFSKYSGQVPNPIVAQLFHSAIEDQRCESILDWEDVDA